MRGIALRVASQSLCLQPVLEVAGASGTERMFVTRAGCPALHRVHPGNSALSSFSPARRSPQWAHKLLGHRGCDACAWTRSEVRGRSVIMAAASVTTRSPYPSEQSFYIFPAFRPIRTFWSCCSRGRWGISTLSWVRLPRAGWPGPWGQAGGSSLGQCPAALASTRPGHTLSPHLPSQIRGGHFINWDALGHTGPYRMHWAILGSIGLYWDAVGHTGTHWAM